MISAQGSEERWARTRPGMGGQRLLGRAGPSRPPRTAGVTGWRAVGPPVTRCLPRAAAAPEPGGPGEVWGEPLLPPEGQLPSHPATRGRLLRPPPSKARGAQPYLPLQRHGPHGQAAHGLICDLPPPHGEVVEGVGQLLGVILRRDLRQAGARQQSVPEGTWASGRQRPLLVDTRTCNPPPQPAFRCGPERAGCLPSSGLAPADATEKAASGQRAPGLGPPPCPLWAVRPGLLSPMGPRLCSCDATTPACTQKGADQAPAAKVPLDLGRPLAAGCFQPRGREAGPPLPHGPCRGAGHWLLSFKVLSDPGSGFMSLRWFLWITENYKSQGGSCGGGRRGGRALTEAQGQPVLCCPGPQSAQLPEQHPPNRGTGMACTGAQQRPGPGLAGGPLCPWGGWG